jgi:hypothetical protein
MPAWIAERFDSRPSSEGDENRIDLIFIVRGTNDEAEVRNLVKLNAPAMYADLSLVQIDTEPQGGDLWYATARYKLIDFPSDYEFDTSGGTQRISTSLATLQRLSVPGYVAPNYQGAIGVTEDRVEGVDITVPVFNFSETKYIDALNVTPSFKYNLFLLTGKVNNNWFKGYAKGELLFLGATGSKRGRERWAITYKFAASPNVVNQPIGDSGMMVSKEGWQYLWVRFVDDEDPTAKTLIKRPVAAYVEQVYPYGDFSTLGIGV